MAPYFPEDGKKRVKRIADFRIRTYTIEDHKVFNQNCSTLQLNVNV